MAVTKYKKCHNLTQQASTQDIMEQREAVPHKSISEQSLILPSRI